MISRAIAGPDPAVIAHISDPFFHARIGRAFETLQKALKKSKRPYLAFSGGKDSMAVLALVLDIRPDITISWTDDELEYPETITPQEEIRARYPDQYMVSLTNATHAGWFVPWSDPTGNYWRDPLPGAQRVTIDFDTWMGQQGYDLTILGLRAEESQKRRDWLSGSGPTYRVKTGTGRRCCPIWDWTANDVWALLTVSSVAIVNPVYDTLTELGVGRQSQRVGPLPLTPRNHLMGGWPDLYDRLVARYGPRWS